MYSFFNTTEGIVEGYVNRLVENDKTLETVDCSQLNLDSLFSKAIFTAIKQSNHLKILKFLGNKPGEAIRDLAESIKKHQSLQEIYLGTNGLNDQEFSYLTDVLIENQSTVQLLDINYNEGITDESVPNIVALIEKCTHLKKLEISSTKITDDGLKMILQALENNPQSPLLELCEPDILNFGFLTQDKELIKKFNDIFNSKQNNNELTI
ncbi:MAG: hypothetical protein H0U73_08310 [Tatlockia sp.]|nr:hypothetical protein [Tatlockia sp.]